MAAAPPLSGTFDYDLVVIGGGSGGLSAAKRAGELGKRVALCDYVAPSPQGSTWGLGGTCVNVGCIPKKLMHQSAQQGDVLREQCGSYGWTAGSVSFDWSVLQQNVMDYIKSLNWGYAVALQDKNVTYFNCFASFGDDAHTLLLTNKQGTVSSITTEHVLLAMGGRPSLPDISGAKEFGISSDDIFFLPSAPKKTLVVGASYVALECAGFLRGMGYPVTVMMRSVPLRGFDVDCAEKIVSFMSEVGGTTFVKGVPTKLERPAPDGQIVVSYTANSGEMLTDVFDTVLFATGRRPEVRGMNLERVGVSLAPSGKIVVDDEERTTVQNIFAIGDIIEGGVELTPVAIRAGKLLANRLFNNDSKKMRYDLCPTTVFTPLEYGCVGLSEEKAAEKFGMVEVYHSYFQPLEWNLPHMEGNRCYMKIIVNPFDDERVLGFHVLAPNAGEITQGVAVAMTAGVTKALFDDTIGIHPTVAEEMTILTISKSSGEDAKKAGC